MDFKSNSEPIYSGSLNSRNVVIMKARLRYYDVKWSYDRYTNIGP